VAFGGVGAAVGALYLLFPQGTQFALNAANGLAMYTCLYAVIGRAAFPDARDWARLAAFLLPVLAFVLACWARRRALRPWMRAEQAPDFEHLPRFARWMVAVAAVALLSLSLPISRADPATQTAALLVAMAVVAGVSAVSVGDVVRLLADIAAIFREVTPRLAPLAVPIAAYCSIWALLTVVFGCLYRIADGLSRTPLFAGPDGPIRVDFPAALHFSAVTLSTVGYGDILPRDDGVRLLAMAEALAGQLLLLFGFYEIMRGSPIGTPAVGESDGGGPAAEEGDDDGAPATPPPPRSAPRP
jgi:ion channel